MENDGGQPPNIFHQAGSARNRLEIGRPHADLGPHCPLTAKIFLAWGPVRARSVGHWWLVLLEPELLLIGILRVQSELCHSPCGSRRYARLGTTARPKAQLPDADVVTPPRLRASSSASPTRYAGRGAVARNAGGEAASPAGKQHGSGSRPRRRRSCSPSPSPRDGRNAPRCRRSRSVTAVWRPTSKLKFVRACTLRPKSSAAAAASPRASTKGECIAWCVCREGWVGGGGTCAGGARLLARARCARARACVCLGVCACGGCLCLSVRVSVMTRALPCSQPQNGKGTRVYSGHSGCSPVGLVGRRVEKCFGKFGAFRGTVAGAALCPRCARAARGREGWDGAR